MDLAIVPARPRTTDESAVGTVAMATVLARLEKFITIPVGSSPLADTSPEIHSLLKRRVISRMLWPLQFRSVPRPSPWVGRGRVSTSPRTRRTHLALACLLAGFAAESNAQVLLLPEAARPPVYAISALELRYADEHPDLPPLAGLLPVEVTLTETEFGWAAPRAKEPSTTHRIGGPASPLIQLEASGLGRVLRVIVAALHERGLYGVDVRPSSDDIDLRSERDLRPEGRTTLDVIVTIGRITQIRTIAVGDRIRDDWKIDNEAHARILRDSPLQPTGAADDDSTDLLDRRQLEDYLYRLNRHSGRRVEAALSPAAEPGEIVLDYRVLEAKPWYVYAQLSDTGTRRTNDWQTRLGATHRQLTNRDDTLSIEWLNAGFDDVNGIRAQYQAPFFGARRPDWMNRHKGDNRLIDWIPREEIPWWGIDRLRWEVDFGWSKSRANRSTSIPSLENDNVTSQQFAYGGRFIYETFQHRDFFIDLWGGLRLRDVQVRNQLVGDLNAGEALFVIPNAGIHAERINQLSTLGIDVSVQGSVQSIDQGELDGLGRDQTDSEYAIIDFSLGYTTFLEPLVAPKAWRDPSTELTSTLAHELSFGLRGQYAFDYRLVPQASQTVGGLHSVRGYDQSAAVGDTVVIGSVEYRFHLPRALPVVREPLRIPLVGDFRAAPQQVYGRPDWDLTLRAFVDVGRSIRNSRPSDAAGASEFDQTLIGAGVGAELQIKSNFRARIDWATALNETVGRIDNPSKVGDSKVHVLFSILY